MKRFRFLPWPFLLGLAAGLLGGMPGCDKDSGPAVNSASGPPPLPETGSRHDPTTTGSVGGRICWTGKIPLVPGYASQVDPLSIEGRTAKQLRPNPHTPRIDPISHGVQNAVVFLRGVDPCRARPWYHPPVRVEVRDHQFHVIQGSSTAQVGFVRRGDGVEFVSKQSTFSAVQGRGDGFFAIPLPDADQPCRRVLDRPGVVELMSGAGHFWMRAHLLVSDHPYYTQPNKDGQFVLSGVPAGEYELVCWLPDWHEAGREYDGDTARLCRVTYRQPQEQVRAVRVEAEQSREVNFELMDGP